MRLPRAPLFLAERLASQGGGVLFTALVARRAEIEDAAAFFAAYAFAAIFQPILSGAVQPIAARYWRAGGLRAVLRIWAIMQGAALLIVGPLIWLAEGPVASLILLHAALAPGLLMATPLATEDRRHRLVGILIAATLLGVALRIGAYLATDDLAVAAVFFAVEPVFAGAALFVASRHLNPGASAGAPDRSYACEAAFLVLTMGVTTIFWRSPVLLADIFLRPEDVIALTLAMQVVMGLCLPANALCQSLFGPLAQGDRTAPGVALWMAVLAAISAPICLALAGEALMIALYGPMGRDAAPLAMMLAPMVGLAALWRFTHILGGLKGLAGELALTRAVALAGQAALAIWLAVAPSTVAIAAITPLSMLLAAIIAPLFVQGLAGQARGAVASARQVAFRAAGRRRALRLMLS